MEHQLIIEHHRGSFKAHCSCGGWREEPISLKVSQVREIYPRIQEEHRRHVRESHLMNRAAISATA